MAKKLSKGEKLEFILSEISDIKSDIKKLLRRSTAEGLGQKARPRSPLASRPKTPAKRTRPQAKPKAKLSPPKPVLVQAMPETQPAEPTPIRAKAREG